jgi:RimJ/RimL family protein N-acetyltransferase
MVRIREIEEADDSGFVELRKTLDSETRFMLREPGEQTMTVEEQRRWIKAIQARDNQTILVAEDGGKLVGFLSAIGGEYRRRSRTVHVVIGILQAHSGRGLGTQLFEELERWSRARDLHRLELTVMVHNERAIRLYRKMGFVIEGTKRHSLLVDGAYVDEYVMARILA